MRSRRCSVGRGMRAIPIFSRCRDESRHLKRAEKARFAYRSLTVAARKKKCRDESRHLKRAEKARFAYRSLTVTARKKKCRDESRHLKRAEKATFAYRSLTVAARKKPHPDGWGLAGEDNALHSVAPLSAGARTEFGRFPARGRPLASRAGWPR